MSKVQPLTPLAGGFITSTVLNDKLQLIEEAFENTVSLDGSLPNEMKVDLSMGDHKIINLKDGVAPSDAATVGQLADLDVPVSGGVVALRADLANVASGKGADLVYNAVRSFDSVDTTGVKLMDTIGAYDKQPGYLLGYYAQGDGGSGPIYWSSTSTVTHNGGTVFKPTAVSGAGRWVRIGYISITPEMFGTKSDGTTDDTTTYQNAVTAAAGKSFTATGIYKLGQISLQSDSLYWLRGALFYPTNATSLFEIAGKSRVTVIGGRCTVASFSPVGASGAYNTAGTAWPNGAFYGGTYINITAGSTEVDVHGQVFEGAFTGVNVYNSTHVHVWHTTHLNGIAGVGVVASIAGNIYDIDVSDNQIIGCGDDGIAFITTNSTGTASIYGCTASRNYIDKTRLGAVASAVGIRAGSLSSGTGTGTVKQMHICENLLRDMVTEGLHLHDITDSEVAFNTVIGYSKITSVAFLLGTSTGHGATRVNFAGNIASGSVTNNNIAMSGYDLSSCWFTNNNLLGNSGDSAFSAPNVTHCIFTGNTFSNAGGPAMRLTTTSDHNIIVNNDFSGATSPVVVAPGANNLVKLNKGMLFRDFETPGNGGTVTPTITVCDFVAIACVGGVTAITIGAVAGTPYGGQELTVSVRNQNGASNLTVTWNASYKLAAYAVIANATTRVIKFRWDNDNSVWVEQYRSPTDIPN